MLKAEGVKEAPAKERMVYQEQKEKKS